MTQEEKAKHYNEALKEALEGTFVNTINYY